MFSTRPKPHSLTSVLDLHFLLRIARTVLFFPNYTLTPFITRPCIWIFFPLHITARNLKLCNNLYIQHLRNTGCMYSVQIYFWNQYQLTHTHTHAPAHQLDTKTCDTCFLETFLFYHNFSVGQKHNFTYCMHEHQLSQKLFLNSPGPRICSLTLFIE